MNIKKYFIPDNFFWRLLAGKEGTRRFWSLVHNSPLHWWISLLVPNRGTRSILFGVHQFLWHPWTVARAWRSLYGKWPTFNESVAIFCHDLGYWGKPNMDGPQGQTHPEGGAELASKIVYRTMRLRGYGPAYSLYAANHIFELSLFHSTHYSQRRSMPTSALYLPDKACVLFDPPWFYLLRARLSGELKEYVNNERIKTGHHFTEKEWLIQYRWRIQHKVSMFRLSHAA